MNEARILVVGSVRFSLQMLKKLIEYKANVCGVVAKRSSSYNADFADLGPFCDINGIPYHHAVDVNSRVTVDWVRGLDSDLGLCLGWSRLLSNELLRVPRRGFLGFHPAELPKNRGRHPIIWALALGLRQTGSTFFWMEPEADSGSIASQKTISVSKQDDAASLYEKIERAAEVQLLEILTQLDSGHIPRLSQDATQISHWRKRSAADGRIDWRMAAETIYDLTRAITRPYPGATFLHGDQEFVLWKSCVSTLEFPVNIEPGRVLLGGRTPTIKCGIGALDIVQCEPNIDLVAGDLI